MRHEQTKWDIETNLRDIRLWEQARAGCEDAFEQLLELYKPLIRSLSQKYFIQGSDREDVVQEAMIGLFRAIRQFDPNKHVVFAAFVKQSSEHQIIDAVRKASTLRNQVLNDSLSLYEESVETVQDMAADSTGTADYSSLPREQHIRELLSQFEYDVLLLRFHALSYTDIAKKMNCTLKQVDNALQRVRRKLHSIDMFL